MLYSLMPIHDYTHVYCEYTQWVWGLESLIAAVVLLY